MLAEGPSGHGCICVARHAPPINAFAQGYSVRLTRAPSTSVSPKRTPLPCSPPQTPASCVPRRQLGWKSSPSIPATGGELSSSVIVSARSEDHEPGSRLHHLLSASRAEQAVLERGLGRVEAGDELARRDVGTAGGGEDVEAAVPGADPDPLLDTVVKGVPPGAADLRDAGARRRLPAPAREARAGDGRLAVAGEALDVGTVEGVGARGRHAPGVRAELGAAGACRPSSRRRRRTSRTARLRTSQPAPRPPRPAAPPPPARSPSPRSAPVHPACPTSTLRSLACVRGTKAGSAETLPPGDRAAAWTPLRE